MEVSKIKKVIYSVTRVGKKENQKFSSLGYITDADLLIARVSKNSKPYIRVFENCVKNCHPFIGKQDEYSGSHYELNNLILK